MTITKTNIPAASLLNRLVSTYDYADSFQSTIPDREDQLTPANIGVAFFSSAPGWIGTLFNLRNKIVSLLGLKTANNTGRRDRLNKPRFEKGDRVGSFNIYEKTADEIILGEDDKHLNFRLSLFLKSNNETEKQLTISTIVEFKNLFGRLYFLFVKPFHLIIVPAMLRSLTRSKVKYEIKTNYPN